MAYEAYLEYVKTLEKDAESISEIRMDLKCKDNLNVVYANAIKKDNLLTINHSALIKHWQDLRNKNRTNGKKKVF